MTFLIVGVIQLVMMQHARLMTEYAAYNAARAGIVWNADRYVMESAAIISLLPTYEGVIEQADITNPTEMLMHIVQRALLYQVHRRLEQGVSLVQAGSDEIIDQLPFGSDQMRELRDRILNQYADAGDQALRDAITGALGGHQRRMVEVQILNPTHDSFDPFSNPSGSGDEADFDNPELRDVNRLTIRVQYLYMLRVPFANWIIHQAWLAGEAGTRLYGQIWRASTSPESVGLERQVQGFDSNTVPDAWGDGLLPDLARIARDTGTYLIPLRASYTMRMQSNPYRLSVEEQ
jgi:hypothetical protein